MKIQFEVINQKLTRAKAHLNEKVVADSKNYLIANFNFRTEEWKNLQVWAIFTHNNQSFKRLLGVDGLEFNECYIPFEVIHTPNFEVSLYAGDRITTNSYKVQVDPSGYTETALNESFTTPSVVEQADKLFQEYAKICNDILLECRAILEECKNLKGGGDE